MIRQRVCQPQHGDVVVIGDPVEVGVLHHMDHLVAISPGTVHVVFSD